MPPENQFRNLRLFLNIWAVLCILAMGINWSAFMFQILAFNPGGPLNWMIWDDVYGHVGPMIFVIYIVWSVYLFKAAKDPIAYATFLEFTLWANVAHSLVMVPMALDEDLYHSKFLTDIPFILLLSLGIYVWGPSAQKINT